jgi:hypothetical protein
MDHSSLTKLAATLREAADLIVEEPEETPSSVTKVAAETKTEYLDTKQVLNFLKFFG